MHLFILIHLAVYLFILMYLAARFILLRLSAWFFFHIRVVWLGTYFIILTYLAGHMPAPSPGRKISSSNSSCALSFGIGTTSNWDIDSCFDFKVFCLRQDMVLEGFGILLVLLDSQYSHILVFLWSSSLFESHFGSAISEDFLDSRF